MDDVGGVNSVRHSHGLWPRARGPPNMSVPPAVTLPFQMRHLYVGSRELRVHNFQGLNSC